METRAEERLRSRRTFQILPRLAPMSSAKLTFLYRATSTVVLWALTLGTIFSGFQEGFFVLISILGMLALWEYYRMLDHASLPNFKLVGMFSGAVFLVGSFYYYRRVGPAESYDFEMTVILFFLLVVFTRQLFERTRDVSPIETMAYTLFGLLYVLWLFNFVTKITFMLPGGHFYVLFLLVVTKFSDMGAYLTGSAVGRHPLIPHISPKKTWEGFFGALGFSVLGAHGLYWLMPDHLSYFNAVHLTILGLLLGFAAIIGDLAESVVKRSTNTKDSGSILPGIGGTLDLIDSLLFTAPLLFFYMRLVLHIGVKTPLP
jgi:phosphatidate cytidylyltransferase